MSWFALTDFNCNFFQFNVPTDDLESLAETYKTALHEMKRILAEEEDENLKKVKSNKQQKLGKFKRKRTDSVNSK